MFYYNYLKDYKFGYIKYLTPKYIPAKRKKYIALMGNNLRLTAILSEQTIT